MALFLGVAVSVIGSTIGVCLPPPFVLVMFCKYFSGSFLCRGRSLVEGDGLAVAIIPGLGATGQCFAVIIRAVHKVVFIIVLGAFAAGTVGTILARCGHFGWDISATWALDRGLDTTVSW